MLTYPHVMHKHVINTQRISTCVRCHICTNSNTAIPTYMYHLTVPASVGDKKEWKTGSPKIKIVGFYDCLTAILHRQHGQNMAYSETCWERPLPWETTCLGRPHICGRKTYISIQVNLSPETTCLDRPHFCGQWGGLSRQVLLYKAVPLREMSMMTGWKWPWTE